MKSTLSARPPENRVRSVIELSCVLFLLLVEVWFPPAEHWRSVLSGLVVVAVMWASVARREAPSSSPTAWFRGSEGATGAKSAWIEAGIVTTLMALALWVWIAHSREPYDTFDLLGSSRGFLAVCVFVGRRLILAGIQQLVLQHFLRPVCGELVRGGLAASMLAAGLFAALHLPSPKLAIATGVAALAWIELFRRSRRLVPLIVGHALLAGLATTVAPERMFYDNEVGRRAVESPRGYSTLGHADVRSLLRVLTSEKYFSNGFGSSPRDFVAGVYRDVLGRNATPGELRFWTREWDPGSRVGVVKSLLVSPELDATRDSLWKRRIDRNPMPAQRVISPSSAGIQTTGFSIVDSGWRWRADGTAEIHFRETPTDPARAYSLDLQWVSKPLAKVEAALNLRPLEAIELPTRPPSSRLIVDPSVFYESRENSLVLSSPRSSPDLLPPDLVSIHLQPLRFPSTSIVHTDDAYFLDGFSIAEASFRWTQDTAARIVYPLRDIEAGAVYALEMTAGTYGHQQAVEILFNGAPLGRWVLSGIEAQTFRAEIEPSLVLDGVNRITFLLPDSVVPDNDPRRLGLAFMALRLYPRPAVALAGRAPFR